MIAPGTLYTDGDLLYEVKGNDGVVIQYRELWPDGEIFYRICSAHGWEKDVEDQILKEVPKCKLIS